MRENSLFIATLASPAGVVCSYIVAAIVSSRWQLNFLISAIGLFIFAILWELCVLFVTPYLKDNEFQNNNIGNAPEISEDAPKFKTLLLSYGILLLFAIAILRSAFDLGLRVLTSSIINESYDSLSPELSTVLSIVVIVAGIFGSLFGSVIYPRFIRNEALAIVIFFACASPFVCLLLFVGKISYIWIVVFLAFMVFILSTASMFTSSYIASRFNKWNMGATVAAFVNGGAALGIVVANMLFTAIADSNGWLFTIKVWIFIMAGAIILSLIFLSIWTKFLKKR